MSNHLQSAGVPLTVDVANLPVFTTSDRAASIAVIVPAAANLGGGTLTVNARPRGSTFTFEPLNNGTPLALGDQIVMTVGGQMEIAVTLAGSTGADIDLMVSEVP